MTVYMKLLHGRNDPDQQMNNWGFDGPVLGPFEAVHFTYLTHVRCFHQNGEEALELCYRGDMLVHEEKYYGDFEIAERFDCSVPTADPVLEMLEEQTEAAQAVIDSWEHGDLAGAVNMLDGLIATSCAVIAKAKGGAL